MLRIFETLAAKEDQGEDCDDRDESEDECVLGRGSVVPAPGLGSGRVGSTMGRTRIGRRHDRLAIEWTCHAGPGSRAPTNGTEVRFLLVANEERRDKCVQTSHVFFTSFPD